MWKLMEKDKRIKKLVVVTGFFVSFVSVLMLGGNTAWAVKCVCGGTVNGRTYSASTSNGSIKYACEKIRANPSTPQGVMWVSDTQDDTIINTQIRVRNWVDGTYPVYLHGAVISSAGTGGGATHINLAVGSGQIHNSCTNCGLSFFSGVPSSISRPGFKPCDSRDFSTGVVPFTLNVQTLLDDPQYHYTESDTERVYDTMSLQAFRCFEGNNPPSAGCFSSSFSLDITVELVKLIGIPRLADGTVIGDKFETKPVSPGSGKLLHFKAVDVRKDNNGESYYFRGWSSKSSGSKYDLGTGDEYISDPIDKSKTVYAVYQKKQTVKLTSYAYDINGKKLKNNACNVASKKTFPGVEVDVTVGGCTTSDNYFFKCWKVNPSPNGACLSSDPNNGRITEASLTKRIKEDTNVYAIYEQKAPTNITLKSYAYDSNGNSLRSSPCDQKTISGSGDASVSRCELSDYKFVCWKDQPSTSSNCLHTGGNNVDVTGSSITKTISENTNVYAIYRKIITLKSYAYDDNKSPLQGVPSPCDSVSGEIPTGSTTVDLTVSSCTAPAGYKFVCWKNDLSSSCISSNDSSRVSSSSITKAVSSDTVVYAIYRKDGGSGGKQATLSSYGYDTDGNALSYGACDSATVNVPDDGSMVDATVASCNVGSCYKYVGWKNNLSDSSYIYSTSDPSRVTSGHLTKRINTNTSVYVIYEKMSDDECSPPPPPPQITYVYVGLNAYAEDTDGNALNNGRMIDSDGRMVEDGYSATLTVDSTGFSNQVASQGYRFIGWREGPWRSVPIVSTAPSYSDTLYGTRNVYAIYERDYYEGKTSVSGSASKTTGYVSESTTDNAFIENCSSTSGCNITFDHDLRLAKGQSAAEYYVTRFSNLSSDESPRSISSETIVPKTIWKGEVGEEKKIKVDGPLTLYPGMIVCERLYFKLESSSDDDYKYTEICVTAGGNAQPDDPGNKDDPEDPNSLSGDESFVNIKVRNASVSQSHQYYKYQKEVYAKPEDTVAFRSVYNPVLQYTYYLRPEAIRIDNGQAEIKNTTNTLGSLFNSNRGSLQPWNNGFGVQFRRRKADSSSSNWNSAELIGNYTYDAGSTTRQTLDPHEVKVQNNDAGKDINEKATTSLNSNTQTTPSQVSFTNAGNYSVGNITTASRSAEAHAYVPYNFVIETEIVTPETKEGTDEPNDEVLSAGEEATIQTRINVEEKPNGLTTDDPNNKDEWYATNADDVKSQLIIYDPSKTDGVKGPGVMNGDRNADICTGYFGRDNDNEACGYSSSNNDTANYEANSSNDVNKNFVVQDLPAGHKICVALAVFPADSGADNNWDNKNYSSSWRISESKCYPVAKKPNMQVVGGNVYVNGGIKTSLVKKKHLLNYNSYNSSVLTAKPYVFGSWGELGLTATKSVEGFASGASLGYLEIDGEGILWPDPKFNSYEKRGDYPGGSRVSSFCKLSPLTIGNECSNSSVGRVGVKSATGTVVRDKDSVIGLVERYAGAEGGVEVEGDQLIINDEDTTSYYHKNGSLTVNGDINLHGNTTKVISAEGDIVVNANINFADESYTKLGEAPKLVIYAKNNIMIGCNVERIDAVLMANEVNTCNSGNINSSENATQLIINGAVIANKLLPNRTYGAAQGTNSMVPAEIINFDPTLYLWGGSSMNDAGEKNPDMDVTYIRELAPRF